MRAVVTERVDMCVILIKSRLNGYGLSASLPITTSYYVGADVRGALWQATARAPRNHVIETCHTARDRALLACDVAMPTHFIRCVCASRFATRLVLVVVGVLLSRAAPAQQGLAAGATARGDVFAPLLADPQEPGFFVTYVVASTPNLAPRIGSVGLGQTIALLRSQTSRWQLSVAAGVFSQFDLASSTNHLMNTDYVIGLPVAYRRGTQSARIRMYHQSSHLGEKFVDGGSVRRQSLSFEALEVLLADELSSWRLYAGGEYRFHRAPRDMNPTVVHAGLEYRRPKPLVTLGDVGEGRLVAALDAKSFEDRDWQVGWSLKTGLAFSSPRAISSGAPHWSVMLTAYNGPTPYGQFYRENLSSVGLGIALGL
jgi:hypothetical protein